MQTTEKLAALRAAGACEAPARTGGRPITYTDLFAAGLSGGADSAAACPKTAVSFAHRYQLSII